MNKKPFDQRTAQEVEIAQQIRNKNKTIVEQQGLAKSAVNQKILKKEMPKKKIPENGFVSVALIALFIGLVIGILSILLISIMH